MSKEELVVEEAPVEEAAVEETPEELEAKQKKAATSAFILGIISLVLGWFLTWLLGGFVGGLVGIITGAIALGKAKKAKGVEVKPAKIFRLIGLILGIIGLVFGILDIIFAIILFCLVVLVGLGLGVYAFVVYGLPAIQEAMQASLALLAL